MKKYLIFAGILGGGFLAYQMIIKNRLQQSTSLTPFAAGSPNPNLVSQPAQTYPFQAAVPQRADNSNQPWYQGNRNFIQPTSFDTNFLQNVQYVKGVAEITKSVSSIWDDLGGLFSTQESPDVAMNGEDDDWGVDWSALSFGDNAASFNAASFNA